MSRPRLRGGPPLERCRFRAATMAIGAAAVGWRLKVGRVQGVFSEAVTQVWANLRRGRLVRARPRSSPRLITEVVLRPLRADALEVLGEQPNMK